MQSDNKFIMILLIIIVVLGIIMGLKVTGVIKPAKKNLNTIENQKTDNFEISTEIENVTFDELLFDTHEKMDLINDLKRKTMITTIIITIIMIIINIGIGKLYEKLSMPEWASSFQKVYPFIILIASLLLSKIQPVITLLISIITLAIQIYYFKSLEMKGTWPIIGIGAMIMVSIGASTSLNSGLFEQAKSSSGGSFWTILGFAMFVVYIGSYIVSNIRLAKRFDKGIGFTIGLVLLPFIFQPILGFSSEY